MKFRSNKCMAIHVPDLGKAEQFYSSVMGFKLLQKSKKYLEYQTGHFLLYVNLDEETIGPIPSFSVGSVKEARKLLQQGGCTILEDRKTSLYFQDPFGIVYDVVEG